VARDIVARRGYVGLSMHAAAGAAGMTEDVARRYYRNRDSLFAAAMRLPVDPVSAIPALVAPGIEGMGERLVRFTLDTLRDPDVRDELISLARTGSSAGHAVAGLQDFIEIGVVDRVAGMIGIPDARMRSALITSYLVGVATMRYGVRLEPLSSASDEEVIRMVAPVIQDLLDPRRPIPGSDRARARARTSDEQSGAREATPARSFDPDPAATRAAQAARIAQEVDVLRRGEQSHPEAGRSRRTETPKPSSRVRASSASTGPTSRSRSQAAGKSAAGRKGAAAGAKPGTPAAPAKPAPKQPAASKRAPTKPAATKPAQPKPAAANPAPKKPAATRPAEKKPTEKKPAAKKPAAKKPTAKKPTAKKPAERKPAAKRPPSGSAGSAPGEDGPKHAK
jgi:AcrR family transcriptional regulator